MRRSAIPEHSALPGRSTRADQLVLVALRADKFPFIGESHGVCALGGYLRDNFPDLAVTILDLQLVAVDEVADEIARLRPALLGISVKLQTWNHLHGLLDALGERLTPATWPLVVLGNAVANFNDEAILADHLPNALIAVGEGEPALHDLVLCVRGQLRLDQVRNVSYRTSDGVRRAAKVYLDPRLVAAADRRNSLEFYSRGGEVYVEASRGCAYGMCSFCSCSGFLGATVRSDKWRPRPVDHVVAELEALAKLGIRDVTFSDEDFFGIGPAALDRTGELARAIAAANVGIRFRINVWVKSLFQGGQRAEEAQRKSETIEILRDAGLVKVFLGLESGVESQLARYRKGFSLEEFNGAYALLRRHGISCEFGFILLDPVMRFAELSDALDFLRRMDYIHAISSIYKELRVQVGNEYVKVVRDAERASGRRLLGPFDFNSQGYPLVGFLDDDVAFFALWMRPWVDAIYQLFYVLRIFTQYAAQGDAPSRVRPFHRAACHWAIRELRTTEFELLEEMVGLIGRRGRDERAAESLVDAAERRRRAVVGCLRDELWQWGPLPELKELRTQIAAYLCGGTRDAGQATLPVGGAGIP